MKELEAQATIITQGEAGSEFYVLLEGEVQCSVDGNVVKTCQGGTKDCYFGELALLYSTPRAATVTSATPVTLAVLDGDSFKHIVTAAQILKDRKDQISKEMEHEF